MQTRAYAKKSSAVRSHLQPAAFGCSERTLNKALGGIRLKLDAVSFGKKKKTDAEIPKLVESIRQMTEWLMWGETYDASLFDLFCEHEMLGCLLASLRATQSPYAVKLQVLQSLSIIVQNVQRETSIIFLLSGGLLNAFFADPPILDDEEMMAYFVTLLKGVVLRLHPENAQLCLTHCKGDLGTGAVWLRMPVFERSIALLYHKDAMVQTAARTAILSIARLESPLVQTAIEGSTISLLAPSLAQVALGVSQHTESSAGGLHDAINYMEELLGFVADLFALSFPTVTHALESEGFAMDEHGRTVFLRF